MKSGAILASLVLCAYLPCAKSQVAQGDETRFTVGDIRLEGLQRVSEGTVYNYLPVAMVIAFYQSPATKKIDTDFIAPAIVIRDSLKKEIPNLAALYAPAG